MQNKYAKIKLIVNTNHKAVIISPNLIELNSDANSSTKVDA